MTISILAARHGGLPRCGPNVPMTIIANAKLTSVGGEGFSVMSARVSTRVVIPFCILKTMLTATLCLRQQIIKMQLYIIWKAS
jgi:hypothetical protein